MDNYFYHRRWPIFYLDNHLLVLYKPAGLLTQGDKTGDVSLLDLAKNWVGSRFNKPGNVYLGLVHRLDRPAAGVMVFARTSKAAGRLSSQFRESSVEKRYLAAVVGRPPEESELLIDYIRKIDERAEICSFGASGAKEAKLKYRLAAEESGRSLIDVELISGRKHQIRLQFSNLGLPIIGDFRYGSKIELGQKQIALLARSISFDHPTTKERLNFVCPLPEGWPSPFEPNTTAEEDAPLWNWIDYANETPEL